MNNSSGSLLAIGAFAGVLFGPAAAPAFAQKTHIVEVGAFGDDLFDPEDLTIAVGDTVQWLWVDDEDHNVESGVDGVHDGNFTSGSPTDVVGTTFEVTFDQAFLDANPMPDDHYPYYCILHFDDGMIGSVTVEPAAACPGDVDDSGDVGFTDLLAVLSSWGPCPGCPEDIDDDDTVGFTDLLAVLSSWGPCP
jgi:plastocyanin